MSVRWGARWCLQALVIALGCSGVPAIALAGGTGLSCTSMTVEAIANRPGWFRFTVHGTTDAAGITGFRFTFNDGTQATVPFNQPFIDKQALSDTLSAHGAILSGFEATPLSDTCFASVTTNVNKGTPTTTAPAAPSSAAPTTTAPAPEQAPIPATGAGSALGAAAGIGFMSAAIGLYMRSRRIHVGPL
jgi:hypothetical protein